MKLLKALGAVGFISAVATCINITSEPVFAACNPFGCSQSTVAECNPFGCPQAPMGQACTPFGCPQSPQPQPQQPTNVYVNPAAQPVLVQPGGQPVYLQNGVQPGGQPVYLQNGVQPVLVQPGGQPVYTPQTQQSGTQVPINQGYNLVGGVWFGPDGQPVSSDRRPGEDQATCIARIRFYTLEAYSRSETHGDYRYNRPSFITEKQMYSAGLDNKGGVFDAAKWRGSQPQVTLTVMDSQEATIRCR